MKSLLLFSCLLVSTFSWSQTRNALPSTGLVKTSEDQYNEQTEKCKVGSSSNPVLSSSPSPSKESNSSKVKER